MGSQLQAGSTTGGASVLVFFGVVREESALPNHNEGIFWVRCLIKLVVGGASNGCVMTACTAYI